MSDRPVTEILNPVLMYMLFKYFDLLLEHKGLHRKQFLHSKHFERLLQKQLELEKKLSPHSRLLHLAQYLVDEQTALGK